MNILLLFSDNTGDDLALIQDTLHDACSKVSRDWKIDAYTNVFDMVQMADEPQNYTLALMQLPPGELALQHAQSFAKHLNKASVPLIFLGNDAKTQDFARQWSATCGIEAAAAMSPANLAYYLPKHIVAISSRRNLVQSAAARDLLAAGKLVCLDEKRPHDRKTSPIASMSGATVLRLPSRLRLVTEELA